MTRYFFTVETAAGPSDRIGMNLESLAQVKHEALRRAAEFASDSGNLDAPGVVVVTARDGSGEAIMTVSLVCTVELARHPLGAFAP